MARGDDESIRYFIAEYGGMTAEEKNCYWGRKVVGGWGMGGES